MSHGSLPRSRRCADGLRASAARSRSRRDTTLLIAAPRAAPHQPPAFVAANRSQFVSSKTRSHTILPASSLPGPPLPCTSLACPTAGCPWAHLGRGCGHTWAAAVATASRRSAWQSAPLWPANVRTPTLLRAPSTNVRIPTVCAAAGNSLRCCGQRISPWLRLRGPRARVPPGSGAAASLLL